MPKPKPKAGNRALAAKFGLGLFVSDKSQEVLTRSHVAMDAHGAKNPLKHTIFRQKFARRQLDAQINEIFSKYSAYYMSRSYPSNKQNTDLLNKIAEEIDNFIGLVLRLTPQEHFIVRRVNSISRSAPGAGGDDFYESVNAISKLPIARMNSDPKLKAQVMNLDVFDDELDSRKSPTQYLCEQVKILLLGNDVAKIPHNLKINEPDGFESPTIHLLSVLVRALDPNISVKEIRSALESRRRGAVR